MKKKGRVAVQFGKSTQDKKGAGSSAAASTSNSSSLKKSKKKAPHALIERSWTAHSQFEELLKEDRDIVLDRIQKEIVNVLHAQPTAQHPSPASSSFQSYIVRGVNQVARLIAQSELRVVVFANNPESLVFAHIPLLCRLHRVPICVLHLSSKTFGKMFQLNSVVVLGIKKLPSTSSSLVAPSDLTTTSHDEATQAKEATPPLSEVERSKLDSISEFLISKASKKNNNLQ